MCNYFSFRCQVGICRENVGDISLVCPDVRDVIINGFETRHLAAASPQQCVTCESEEAKCREEWNVPGLAAQLQADCAYKRNDRSVCTLPAGVLARYFLPRTIADPFWSAVPVRLEVKYSCCSEFVIYETEIVSEDSISFFDIKPCYKIVAHGQDDYECK